MIIVRIQAALFPLSGGFIGPWDSLSVDLRKSLNLQQASGAVTGIPDLEVSNVIPRISISSNDNETTKENITVAPSRADYVVDINPNVGMANIEEAYLSRVKDIFTILNSNARIGRVGITPTFFSSTSNDVDLLLSRYFRTDAVSSEGLTELALRYNHRKEFQESIFNKVVNISPGKIDKDGESQKGLVIQLDMNTLEDQAGKFSPELLERLMSFVKNEVVGVKALIE